MKQTIEIEVPDGYELRNQEQIYDGTIFSHVNLIFRKKTHTVIVFVPDENGLYTQDPCSQGMNFVLSGRKTTVQRYRREEREVDV